MDSPNSDGILSPNTLQKDTEIRRLTKLLEESTQDAYELRSRLQVVERLSHDYEAELEALHQDALEKDNKHAAAIREIQEEKYIALKDAKEKIEDWEAEYQMMSDKVARLEKELLAKSVIPDKLSIEKNKVAALQQELEETLDALTSSTVACKQHMELIAVLQTEKKVLGQQVEFLQQELELCKEHLMVSKEQLSAQTEEFKELQEHLAVVQTELSVLKATPDVQSRGNSLFAEVEDKRQQMVKQYKLMAAKFNDMKNNYSAKCAEIVKMKKERNILLDKLESAEKDAKRHYRGFVENYEIRIEELQKTVSDLKKDVKPVYLNGNDQILKYTEHVVTNSRKEVESLREEMELRSALRLNEAAELLKTRAELAQARSDLRKYSLKVVDLTSALKGQGVTNLPSPAPVAVFLSPEEKIPKSNLVALKKQDGVPFDEDLLPPNFNAKRGTQKKSGFEGSIHSPVSMGAYSCGSDSIEVEPQPLSDKVNRATKLESSKIGVFSLDSSVSIGASVWGSDSCELEPQPLSDNVNTENKLKSSKIGVFSLDSSVSMGASGCGSNSSELEPQPLSDKVNTENKMKSSKIGVFSLDSSDSMGASGCCSDSNEPEAQPLPDKFNTENEFESSQIGFLSTFSPVNKSVPSHDFSGGELLDRALRSSDCLNSGDDSVLKTTHQPTPEKIEVSPSLDSSEGKEANTTGQLAPEKIEVSPLPDYSEGKEVKTTGQSTPEKIEGSPLFDSSEGKEVKTTGQLTPEKIEVSPLPDSSEGKEAKTTGQSTPEKIEVSPLPDSSEGKEAKTTSQSTPEKIEVSPLPDSSERKEAPRSILKVRTDYMGFDNSVETLRKELRFEKEAEKVESNKESGGEIAAVAVEENKENCEETKVKEEEKIPRRRRPRPGQQTHRIIYMYDVKDENGDV